MRRALPRFLVVDALLVSVWLATVGLVLRHERGPLFGGGINPIPSLRATTELNDQWFGLYYHGRRIGYAHATLLPEERDGVPGVTLRDQGRLAFTLLGLPQRVDLSAQAFIDADWRLQEFSAELRTDTSRLRWSGERRGDALWLKISTPAGAQTKVVPDPGGRALIGGLAPWAVFHRLEVGQRGSLRLLNPLALAPEDVTFHVQAEEDLEGQRALVIETDVRGVTTTSWVTRQGHVLKEESSLGWQLRQEPMELAMRIDEGDGGLDLLSTTSVPIDRVIERPAQVDRTVWLVHGLAPEALAVERPWQRVLPAEALSAYGRTPPDGAWSLLELRRPELPSEPEDAAVAAQYRAPSLFVESDDPRIRAAATGIVAGQTGSWAQAQALQRWVHERLEKRLTVGFPSALDVLASQSGDCHEHTVLYTALARSVGLPTRMVAGLVYYQARLFYHAWPEVWVGRWLPTDPTLGQPIADATHLGLVEAEGEDLVQLAQFVGRLRAQVLDVREGPRP